MKYSLLGLDLLNIDYSFEASKFLTQEIIISIILFILAQLLFTFFLAKIFVKAGEKWGLAFIPLYRIYKWTNICVDQANAAATAMFIIFMIVSIPFFYMFLGVIYYILIVVSCKKFRLNILIGLLFPYIALVMMAFLPKYYYHPTLK